MMESEVLPRTTAGRVSAWLQDLGFAIHVNLAFKERRIIVNTTLQQNIQGHIAEEQRSLRTMMGGSLIEGFLAGIAVLLAVVGLSGTAPERLLSVATIALGVAFLFQGVAISLRFSRLLAETGKDRLDEAQLGLGMSSEYVSGVAGVVLGILALAGKSPTVLIPAAVVAFGSTLLLGSGLTLRLNALELEASAETTRFKKVAREVMVTAAGSEILLGAGTVVLGIIALAGIHPDTLSLVSLLIVGITGFFSGAAITARMASLFRK